ncbi:MAG: hypothetical protein QOF50_834, partial [Gaiellaceae bacterium]|nr:hypothetical protein [Gaiellaceae bacterium]
FVLTRLGRVEARGPRTQAQQRLVQRLDERAAVSVRERLDQAPAHGFLGAAARTLARDEPAQRLEERSAVAAGLAEQHRRPHRSGPEPVRAAEQRRERLPELLGAKRLGLKERQLPAVERFGELRIGVRGDQASAEVGRDRAALLQSLRGLVAGEGGGRSAEEAVRRGLVEALSHGDRGTLVESLDEALLGLRPRPAGFYAAQAS